MGRGGEQIQGGKIFRPMKMLIFTLVIMFLTFLGFEVKLSTRWDKTHKILKKSTTWVKSGTLKCVGSSS